MTSSPHIPSVMNNSLAIFTNEHEQKNLREENSQAHNQSVIEVDTTEVSRLIDLSSNHSFLDLENKLNTLHSKLDIQLSSLQGNAQVRCLESVTQDHSISLSNLTRSVRQAISSAVMDNDEARAHEGSNTSPYFFALVNSFVGAVGYFFSELRSLILNFSSNEPHSIFSHASSKEKIHLLLNDLAIKGALPLHSRDRILSLVNQGPDGMQEAIVQLSCALHIETFDINLLLNQYIEKKSYIDAFKALKTIWQLNQLFHEQETHTSSLLTQDELTKLLSPSAHNMYTKEELEALHDVVDQIATRSTLFRWLDTLSTTLSIDIDEEVISECKTAIIANDKSLFIKTLELAFKDLGKDGDELSLEGVFSLELLDSLRTSSKSMNDMFHTLAHKITSDTYLSSFISDIREIKSSVKRFIQDLANERGQGSSIDPRDEIRINELLGKIESILEEVESGKEPSLLLGREVSKILQPISQDPLSGTLRSAQIGKMVRTLRKISDLKLKLHTDIFTPNREAAARLRERRVEIKQDKDLPPSGEVDRSDSEANEKGVSNDYLAAMQKTVKVALLKCSYGSGHDSYTHSVEKAIQQHNALDDSAQKLSTVQFDVPDELLKEHDLLYKLTFGKWTTKDLFNWTLRTDNCWIIDLLKKLAGGSSSSDAKRPYVTPREKILLRKVLESGAHAVGMFYTFDKDEISRVTHSLGLPLVHGATDLDVSGWDKGTNHPVFKFLIPSKTNEIVLNTLPETLKEDQVEEVGLVVREPFAKVLSTEEVSRLKQQMNIDEDATVITFSSGGGGMRSRLPELLAKAAAKMNKKFHIFVITGKNEKYKHLLENKVAPSIKSPNVKLTATGFLDADKYHQIMSVSDYFCGKPGGQTTAEVIANNECRKKAGLSPLVFMYDVTSHRFEWEKINGKVTEDLGIGIPIEANSQFLDLLRTELTRDTPREFESLTSNSDETLNKGGLEDNTDELSWFGSKKYPEIFKSLIDEAKVHEELTQKRKSWTSMVKKLSESSKTIL